MKTRNLTLAAALLLPMLPVFAESLETIWTGGGEDLVWGNEANWSAGVPTKTMTASFSGVTEATTIALGDTPVPVGGIVCDTGALMFSGSGTLTLFNATPISGAGTVTVSFACPVVFSADDASVDLNGGALTFGAEATLRALHVAEGRIVCSDAGTISGEFLNLAGFADLSKGMDSSGLTLDNAATEQSGRLAGLAKLRMKGPAQLNIIGGTETLVTEKLEEVVFGEWKTEVKLSGKLDLTFLKADAEPSGFVGLSIGSEARLLSEEANVSGVWKPWVEWTRSNHVAYFWTRGEDKVVTTLKTYTTLASGENKNPDAAFSFNGNVTAFGEIGALRTLDGGTLDLGDNKLTVKSGLIPVRSEYKHFTMKASGAGTLVFGGNDIFTEHGNSIATFSAPVEWIRPQGNTAPGPSLFILGNRWSKFTWNGEDRIGDYNLLYVGNDANQETVFGGPSDRTFHGPLLGSSPIVKKGAGVLRFRGPRITWTKVTVEEGSLALGHPQVNLNSVTLKSDTELRLENDITLNLTPYGIDSDNAGTIFSGIGQLSLKRGWHNLRAGNWLVPGLPDQIGELKIKGTGSDGRFTFLDGTCMRIKVSADSSDKVRFNSSWHYLDFPASASVINLEINAFNKEDVIRLGTEYMFIEDTDSGPRVSNQQNVTWNITTATPKLLDVSRAKVVFRNLGNNRAAFYVTGLKTACSGFLLTIL